MGKTKVSIRAVVTLALAAGVCACGSGGERTTAGGIAPAVHLLASRTSLTAGESLRLSWISSNAERCTASDAWGGLFTPYGSIDLSPQTPGTLHYSLTCSGPGGSGIADVEVLVRPAPAGPGGPGNPEDPAPPAPVVSFGASPLDSPVGTPVTLTWNAANADVCAASGGWSGALAASGSTAVIPPEGSTVYRLACGGEGGSGSAEVTVTARPVAPPEPDAALAEFDRVKDLEEGCCNATQ